MQQPSSGPLVGLRRGTIYKISQEKYFKNIALKTFRKQMLTFKPFFQEPLIVSGYPPQFRPYSSSSSKSRPFTSSSFLPNPRHLSDLIHGGTDGNFNNLTSMVMQLGQFLDHDITLTPEMNLCSKECPSKEEGRSRNT